MTDGEHIGIPLALLLKLARAHTPHVTIGHRLTASKKRPFFRWLRVHSHISRIALHSRRQYELATSDLRIPSEQVAFVPYQVDTEFWQPQPVAEERLICSAGLEFRDYPTLVSAVQDLDLRVVIGAASHWSKRRNTAERGPRPTSVEVGSFDYVALRDLYARSAVVVVPLEDIDFQAGVTTILEAMAMAKPVIVTHTLGQTDVVEDRRTITRGVEPRPARFRPPGRSGPGAKRLLRPAGRSCRSGACDRLSAGASGGACSTGCCWTQGGGAAHDHRPVRQPHARSGRAGLLTRLCWSRLTCCWMRCLAV